MEGNLKMSYLCQRQNPTSKISCACEYVESKGTSWRKLQIAHHRSRLSNTMYSTLKYGRVAHALVSPLVVLVTAGLGIEPHWTDTCQRFEQVSQAVDSLQEVDANSTHSMANSNGMPQRGNGLSPISLDVFDVTDIWSLNPENRMWEFAKRMPDGVWEGTLVGIQPDRCYIGANGSNRQRAAN